MIFRSFPVAPLGCNCSIIGDPISHKALVVDPGGNHEQILATLKELELTVSLILHTHAHFDHFLASGEMHKATGASLCVHRADQWLWDNLEMQCRLFDIPYTSVPPPSHWLEQEETLALGSVTGLAVHTPGHTPGSMCFHFESAKLLIAGDTLFRGSIGRTDLWGGDAGAIEHSIKQRLYVIDEATRVITGHGPETTIEYELRHNQFVRG